MKLLYPHTYIMNQHPNGNKNGPPTNVSSNQTRSDSDRQSPTESDNRPTTSDSDRQSPTSTDSGDQDQEPPVKSDKHILTVREVGRTLHSAGVPRTERTITRWCRPTREGETARLNAVLDTNDGRYYVTEESVDLVIAEEKAKSTAHVEEQQPVSDSVGPVSESPANTSKGPEASPPTQESADKVDELKSQILDLKITNRAKEDYIKKLEELWSQDRTLLLETKYQLGQLETQLQLATAEQNTHTPTDPDDKSPARKPEKEVVHSAEAKID